MLRYLRPTTSFWLVITLAFSAKSFATEFSALHQKTINTLFSIFDKHAYQTEHGVYLSEIDNTGQVQSDKVYNVAFSRMIYGLAYTSNLKPERLARAKHMAKFQLQHLVVTDEHGPFFLPMIQLSKLDAKPALPEKLDIWQQAYGLNGLTELYRQTQDPSLLKQIHQLHQSFVSRFRDQALGGFWGEVNRESGAVENSKSIQSLMYPITAYMANLWLADSANEDLYQSQIIENVTLAAKHGWNNHTNWVNVKLHDDWQPCQSNNSEQPCFTVTAGHNFQLAALLLRVANMPFVPQQQAKAWQQQGHHILANTLNKPIFSGTAANGFYREFNPLTDKHIDNRKSWWQHAEAVLALSIGGDAYDKERQALETFFLTHFIDWQNGGEFFYLAEDNTPDKSTLKGSIGKATYHTIEMLRYLNQPN